MKKSILILLLILVVVVVGIAGCLGGGDNGTGSGNSTNGTGGGNSTNGTDGGNSTNGTDGGNSTNSTNDGNSTNSTTEPPSSGSNSSSGAEIITSFNASVVTVNSLPSGFTHLATRSVNSNTQGLGIPDALNGYRNMLTYNNSNVYLSVYRCVPPTTADDQIQEMITSHQNKYGSDSKVSTVYINGHHAVLLETTVLDTPQEGRYILVWSNWSGDPYDNSYLVVINGQVNYSVIQTLAEASNL